MQFKLQLKCNIQNSMTRVVTTDTEFNLTSLFHGDATIPGIMLKILSLKLIETSGL